jgi:TetR/AcrR family transcriptional repressor of nem operon
MARPRSFDEAEVLAAVMTTFWRRGYTATTTRGLEEVSGVGIRSLANTFGDKDSLFLKALRRYREGAVASIAVAFNPPSVDAVIGFFEGLSSRVEPENPLNSGCLMVNTVFELGEPPDLIAHEIELFRDLWRTTFHQALINDGVSDADTRSVFLLGAFWGSLSLIRLAGDSTAAQPMTTIVTQTVRTWA